VSHPTDTDTDTGTGTDTGISTTTEFRARLEADAREIIGRYPQSRSALLPLLHLVQSEEGFVTAAGIEFCAELLGISTAEVSGVATFYTMYKRHPVGEFSVGVCTNTLCAVMGGDEIFARLKEHLGVGHDETTQDGVLTLEHLECNAACDFAPVMMVNWEFYDDQTPESAIELVDALRAGQRPLPTRGASLCAFREVSRVLAGFPDGRAGEGPSAGPATLVGLAIARERGDRAPEPRTAQADGDTAAADVTQAAATEPDTAPSGHDAPQRTSASDPAHEDEEAR
jgi:NADH-quinone oxidoreductase subunit E